MMRKINILILPICHFSDQDHFDFVNVRNNTYNIAMKHAKQRVILIQNAYNFIPIMEYYQTQYIIGQT